MSDIIDEEGPNPEDGIRILLLEEDNDTIQRIHAILAHRKKCSLQIHSSFQDAVEKASLIQPKILLFGHRIPGKESLEIFIQINHLLPSAYSIVFLPDSGDIWEKPYRQQGAGHFVYKDENFDHAARVLIRETLDQISDDGGLLPDDLADLDDDLASMLCAFQPGDNISHYRILQALGEGGMGEVYKAQDTKLHRTVAIKVLPLVLAKDPRARRRMLREARSVSALNHPNIVSVYSMEEEKGYYFIVMEFIEGESLLDLFQKRSITPIQMAGYATDVARVLHLAHQAGFLHRDIKPANIMFTGNGQVKLLDFGLAKRVHHPSSQEISDSIFLSRLTMDGSILGTATYMSPEQTRGEALDARSDIFSLGTVLYEGCTGRLPFVGSNFVEVSNQICNSDVEPPRKRSPAISKGLETIILKCLEKEPDDRYRNANDLADDLERVVRNEPVQIRQRTLGYKLLKRAKRNPQIAALSALAVLLVLLLGWVTTGLLKARRIVPSAPPESRLVRITTAPGLEDEPALSPDGKQLAYTTDENGNLEIRIMPVRAGAIAQKLVNSKADDAQPAWSPDGKRIAFVSARDQTGHLSILVGLGVGQFVFGRGGDLFIQALGEPNPVKLATNAYYPSWSPNGEWIVYQSDFDRQWDLWKIPAAGGSPVRLTQDSSIDYHPAWSPDGEWIVYASGINPQTTLRVVPSNGGAPVQIQLNLKPGFALKPGWSADSKFIFFSYKTGSANIWKIPFTPGATQASPVRVTTAEDDHGSLSISGNRIIYSATEIGSDIWELLWPSGQMRQITFETTTEEFPHLSPDGDTLVFHTDRTGPFAIWSFSLASGQLLRQLSPAGKIATSARWSPDGKKIVYQLESGERGGKIVLYSLPDARQRELLKIGENPSWSPDGDLLALSRLENNNGDLWVYSPQTLQGKQLTKGPEDDSCPSFSPDAKWIVFQRMLGQSKRALMLIPAAGGSPRELFQENYEDSHPDWNAKNNLILFLREHKNAYVYNPTTKELVKATQWDARNNLLDFPSWSYDGSRIYFSIHKKIGDLVLLETVTQPATK